MSIYDPRPTTRRPRPPMSVRLAASWLTNAVVLGIVALLLHGMHVSSAGALVGAAAVFGILNTVLKPVLRFVTFPLAVLTLGIAWFFVSMLMLVLTRDLVAGFFIHGFGTLVLATVCVWVVNVALDHTPGPWQMTSRRRRQVRPPRGGR